MAVEHPDLQEVWEEEGLIEKISFKQNTYMNLIVSHWEMQHINGMVPREQVEEMLDTYMQRSYFQKFWANSGKYRDRYAKKAALKEEREFFEMVNSAYKKSIRPAAKESTD
jgi:metal-dependent hydrolase (beta-lactamase superfamily II)